MSGTPQPDFLPYGLHAIDDDDVAAVAAALRGDWLTTGPTVDRFEQAFARTVGAGHAVVCSNGTAALHLAALATDLGPGDFVVVPSVTFLATANAVRHVGAEVLFADVDPDTGLMGPAHLSAALGAAGHRHVRAVFPVHLNGQCDDPAGLRRLADAHGLAVVEDACHAIGAGYAGRDGEPSLVGGCQHADLACFSLHPVKTVTMGEGGVVTTNDEALCEALRRFRSHGMTRDAERFSELDQALDGDGRANPWYYEMPDIGFNYRASDVNCALGLSQLKKLAGFVAARRRLAAHYDGTLASLAPLVRPLGRTPRCHPAWHLYVALIDFASAGVERATVMRRLHEAGIGSQVHYLPVHRQPYYRRRYGVQDLPGADAYYARCLSLPLFPAMTERDVDRVIAALARALGI